MAYKYQAKKPYKTPEDRKTINLTTWVSPLQYEEWNRVKEKEGGEGWSEWIAEKVQVALNLETLQQLQDENKVSKDEYNKIHLENLQLKERVKVMESRVFGVLDDRVMSVLGDKWLTFDDIVQKMIDTEAEATFETLQKLAVNRQVEVDSAGNRWRQKL